MNRPRKTLAQMAKEAQRDDGIRKTLAQMAEEAQRESTSEEISQQAGTDIGPIGTKSTSIEGVQGQNIDLIVGRKFLEVYKPKPKSPQKKRDSQNEMADKIERLVSENEWVLFKKSRRIRKSTKRAYFYKLVLDCDSGKCPNWLESLK